MHHSRILLTGITSIHGWPVFKKFQQEFDPDHLFGIRPPKMRVPENRNVTSCCITDAESLTAIKKEFQPTHIIHAAGVCDLDVCEERPHWARKLNVEGAQTIARLFGDSCPILFLSTDLVFSGNNPPEGGYGEHHCPDPVSIAGKTFAEAELVIAQCQHFCIVRLGLPLGDSITGTKGGIDWVKSRFRKNLPVTLFNDEIRSCVPCDDIGKMVWKMFSLGARGVFHFGGIQPMSLFKMGQMVLSQGPYPSSLLTGISRFEEKNGPPRIGNVAFNTSKIGRLLGDNEHNCFENSSYLSLK